MNNIVNLIIQMITNGQNPYQVIEQLVSKNPQAQILFNQMKQSGMNPIQFAIQIAKQYNIPIQQTEISNTFSQMWNMISNKKY